MAKKKNTPLKDEQVYSFEDLYQKLDEIHNTINNKNVQEAHEGLHSKKRLRNHVWFPQAFFHRFNLY